MNDAADVARGRFPGAILLSRALCAHTYLAPRAGLSRRDARRAALVHAEAHAPFTNASHLVVEEGAGFVIWWWDTARVAELLPQDLQGAAVFPEPMAQSPGTGWRVVAGQDGYDAQFWADGVLRASYWRRTPFDAARWSAWTASLGAAAEEAPRNPPTPEPPQWRTDDWRRRIVTPTSTWRSVEQVAWACAAAACLVALGFSGHAARSHVAATEHQVAIDRLSGMVKDDGERTAFVRAASQQAPLPEHLVAAADLVAMLDDAGLETVSWRSRADGVEASARGVADLDRLGAALERNPRLRNVAPLRVDDLIVVTADVELSSASLEDAGR